MPEREDPNAYVDGFNWKTVIGAFFVGLVMMPASIYISLFTGGGLSGAAEWVTIILFAELARRSISSLKKQEVYLLYHVAAGVAGGGVFSGLIWNQFLRQSREAAAFGVAQNMPVWAAPAADSPGILLRQLWHADWWPAIGLILAVQVLIRLNWFGLGYALYRVVSDVERLPFPLARIAAEGATALAESPDKRESWRWRWFSTGSILGLVFGFFFFGLPAVTGLVFTAPITLFPIPWKDLTASTENLLPATPMAISFDLGGILWGMVLPYWMVVGQFAAMVVSIICNPFLQKAGLYPTWHKGMDVLSTQFAIGFDFWISVGAGITFSVALIGLWQLYRSVSARRKGGGGKQASDMDILMGKEGNLMVGGGGGSWKPPKGRGDFPIWIALAMFLVSTGGFVWLCHRLVPGFPVWILAFFGFVWTPLISYVSARMIGLTGGGIGFPFVKEGTLILSGYKGVDIWFAPYPMNDYGGVTLLFKQLDLTRTKFTSIIKAELLMMPLNIVFSFVFWAFFWYLSSIPSSSFPFVDKIWPFNALTSSLWMTATMEGRQWLLEALKAKWIATGLVGGVALYAGLAAFKLPFFLFYGVVSGINAMPSGPIYTLTGALLGRYYFAKRFGEERWFKFAAVLGAGFACGMGLMGMLVVGFTIVPGSVVTKPF